MFWVKSEFTKGLCHIPILCELICYCARDEEKISTSLLLPLKKINKKNEIREINLSASLMYSVSLCKILNEMVA